MRFRWLAVFLVMLWGGVGPAGAATVRLKNGKVLEDCVVTRRGDTVRLKSKGLEFTLPAAQILSIDENTPPRPTPPSTPASTPVPSPTPKPALTPAPTPAPVRTPPSTPTPVRQSSVAPRPSPASSPTPAPQPGGASIPGKTPVPVVASQPDAKLEAMRADMQNMTYASLGPSAEQLATPAGMENMALEPQVGPAMASQWGWQLSGDGRHARWASELWDAVSGMKIGVLPLQISFGKANRKYWAISGQAASGIFDAARPIDLFAPVRKLDGVFSLLLLDDEDRLLCLKGGPGIAQLLLHRISTGEETKLVDLAALGMTGRSRPQIAAVSPGEQYVALVEEGAGPKVVELATGRLAGQSKSISQEEVFGGRKNFAISENGRYAVAGDTVRDLTNDQVVWTAPKQKWMSVEEGNRNLLSMTLDDSPQPRVAVGTDQTIEIWDPFANKQVSRFSIVPPREMGWTELRASDGKTKRYRTEIVQRVESVVFGRGGRFALASQKDGRNARVWNVATGRLQSILAPLSHASGDPFPSFAALANGSDAVAHSAAAAPKPGQPGANAAGPNPPAAGGRTSRPEFGPSGPVGIGSTPGAVLSTQVSPDGKVKVVCYSDGVSLQIQEKGGFREVRRLGGLGNMSALDSPQTQQRKIRDMNAFQSLTAGFSPDGSWVWLAPSRAEFAGGQGIWLFPASLQRDGFRLPNSEGCIGATFSPDGRHLASRHMAGHALIWNVSDGKYCYYVGTGTEWILYTEDGFFEGSRRCGSLLAVVDRKAQRGYPVDQFALRNNRPDVILERLNLCGPELIAHYRAQYERRLRKFGVAESALQSGFQTPETRIVQSTQGDREVTLDLGFSDSACDLKRYNIYVNDVPLFGAYGKPIQGRRAAAREKVELSEGTNKIEAACFNENGAESFRAALWAERKDQAPADLYFLAFGVSKYKDSRINLQYADKDARDLADAFGRLKGARFREVRVKTFLNEQATVENVRQAKKFLEGAKVDDVFVLFIAGHGVHDPDNLAEYYYVTYETDVQNLAGTAANFDLVEDLLQGIPPRRKLFLMDTCESGERDDETARKDFAEAVSRGFQPRAIGIGSTAAAPNPATAQPAAKPKPRPFLLYRNRYIYNDLLRRSGAVVFSSCRGDEYSYESPKYENGFFTEIILQAFQSPDADKDGDKALSVEELREYVAAGVTALSLDRQHPTIDRDNLYQRIGFPFLAPQP